MLNLIRSALVWARARGREDNTRAGLNGLLVVVVSFIVLGMIAFGLPIDTWFDRAEAGVARLTVLLAKVGLLINTVAALPNLRAIVTPDVPVGIVNVFPGSGAVLGSSSPEALVADIAAAPAPEDAP